MCIVRYFKLWIFFILVLSIIICNIEVKILKKFGFLYIFVRKWKLWFFLVRYFMKFRFSVRIMFIEDVMIVG